MADAPLQDQPVAEVPDQPVAEVLAAVPDESTPEAKRQAGIEARQKTAKEMEAKIAARNEGVIKLPVKEQPEAVPESEEASPDAPESAIPQVEKSIVVTEDMVKDNPSWKNLVGQPISELVKASQSLVKQWNQDRQKLAEIEKRKPAPQITQQEVKTFDQIIEARLKDAEIPDPIDDPKANAKAVLKLALEASKEYIEQQNKPYQENLENQKRVQEIQAHEQKATTLLQDYLKGEEVDMKTLSDEFQASVKPIIEDNPSYYFGRPELLASDISRYYFAEKSKKLSQGKPTNVVSELKKKIEGSPSDATKPSLVPKGKKVRTPAEEIEARIVKRLTGEELS